MPATPVEQAPVEKAKALERGRVAAEPPEVVIVDDHRMWCDGLGGALGHPRVYLEMGAKGFVECGYCDRRFVLSSNAHAEHEEAAPADYEGAGGH
jgi:uncharacterized Zn-finger protein